MRRGGVVSLVAALALSPAAVAVAGPATARVSSTSHSLALDVGGVYPTGDFGDGAGLGILASVHLEREISWWFHLSARAGYVKHLEDIHVTFGQVLFLGGAKVYVTPRQWFLFHEVGADIVTAKTRYLGSTVVSDYDTKLGLAGGLGLQRRDWEFRAWLIVPLLLDRVHHARIDPGISILATARWAFARF